MNERRLLSLTAVLLFWTACAPPEAEPRLTREQEANVQINTFVAADTAILGALAHLRAGNPAAFEKATEETVDRYVVALGGVLLQEEEVRADLPDETFTNILCHLHLVKTYRDRYPFDSDYDSIEGTVSDVLSSLPPLPADLASCAELLPPLGDTTPVAPE